MIAPQSVMEMKERRKPVPKNLRRRCCLTVFYLDCGHSIASVPGREAAPETGLWTARRPSYIDGLHVMRCPVHGTDEPAVAAALEDVLSWL
jgi:hypothetical protein